MTADYDDTLEIKMRNVRPPDERFSDHLIYVGDCIVWGGLMSKQGYGRFSIGNKAIRAHRYAYEQVYGPIPLGLTIDHLCSNRCCVNVRHLRAVTNKANVLAPHSQSRTKFNADKEFCKRGHPLSGSNLVLQNNGQARWCRTCRSAALRERYAEKRHDGICVACNEMANGGTIHCALHLAKRKITVNRYYERWKDVKQF